MLTSLEMHICVCMLRVLCVCVSVNYLTATMSLGTVSICMTVCVLNVHHRGAGHKVPKWLHKLVLIWMARIVCVRTSARKTLTEKVYAKRVRHRLKTPTVDGNGVVDDMELIRLTMNNTHTPLKTPQTVRLQCNGPRQEVKQSVPSVREQNQRQSRSSVRTRASSPQRVEVDHSKDWQEMALVLDRIFFWLLFILMTASSVFILLYPKYSGVEPQMFH